ncbi:hypothetical protein LYNGBM3L_70340 [Moorena producens 3L]|uniref:Uncharacterized protein n=1 Tax=Moorena producens 3L TaxID=489825 RepID=F4Y2F1_9CYAN|nr:hypothetical protein LYNGBM3L_70340 [Moorena producens 3L]OLT67392.1 hypothetical protein BI334_22290 [Moorena producens 3L]
MRYTGFFPCSLFPSWEGLGRVFKLRVPPFPLKKGDFEYGSPLNKGGWGGSNILRKTLKTHPRGGFLFPVPCSQIRCSLKPGNLYLTKLKTAIQHGGNQYTFQK